MPLIRQLSRANSLRMDAEMMLLITHIHQPIVAPPAIRVDEGRIAVCSDFLEASGTISV